MAVEKTPTENNGVENGELLNAINDEFDGMIIEMNEPMDSQVFGSLLKASMLKWKEQVRPSTII